MIFAPKTLLNDTRKGRRAMTSTPAQLDELSRERLLSDPSLAPSGYNLVPSPGLKEFVSVSTPRTGPPHETNFPAVPVADFLDVPPDEDQVDWVLEDYLPAGGLVLIAGKPKE